ncbi:MAG: AAA family ATPase, partial [Candidatus Hydrogenedentes bacterium]|nr:AAA family ATPase [Candidatus Hydrogenedentota bacterium]
MSRDFSTVADDFDSDRPRVQTKTPGLHFSIKNFVSLRLFSVVLISAALSLPLAVAGWFIVPDVYTASAVIQFGSVVDRILDQRAGNAATISYAQFVGTELAKITGSIVLSPVLEREEVRELPSVQAKLDKLAFIQGTIRTAKFRNSELVTVSCTMKSRAEALIVLENVMDVYQGQVSQYALDLDNHRVETLNDEIEKTRFELDALRTLIQKLEGKLGAMVGGRPEDSTEAEQYRNEWLKAEERVTQARNGVANAEESDQRIRALQDNHTQNRGAPIYQYGVEEQVIRDPRIVSFQSELDAQESRVSSLEETHKDTHPALEAARRKLESVQRNAEIKKQMARSDVLKTLSSQAALALELAKRVLADEELNLEKNKQHYDDYVDKQESNLTLASKERANIQQLQEKADVKAAFLAQLDAQVQQIQLDEQAPARVRIASPPNAPQSKDRRMKVIMAIVGLMMALGLGMGYGVVRELLDQQIRTRQDMARRSELPTIASIPHLSEDSHLADADCAMLMVQHPNSTVADEYRRILARMLFPEDNAAEVSSLLVVSASTQEGKTSIAANLAIALEQASRRVLLLDLSSQKPDIERVFGLEPAAGLSELLQDEQAREDLVRRTAFENLGIVGPGMDASELASRLASRAMMDFMEWADEHFDHIIVDTPPLLLMSDAKLLAPAVDGVLFVVGAGIPTLGMVSRCLSDLEQLRANIIGIV